MKPQNHVLDKHFVICAVTVYSHMRLTHSSLTRSPPFLKENSSFFLFSLTTELTIHSLSLRLCSCYGLWHLSAWLTGPEQFYCIPNMCTDLQVWDDQSIHLSIFKMQPTYMYYICAWGPLREWLKYFNGSFVL